jgi:hypothetical protein
MKKLIGALTLVMSLMPASQVLAQGGDGSLRGTVRDNQGGALPGVTITAISEVLLGPSVTVTDGAGNYRLINGCGGTFINRAHKGWWSQKA